MWPPLFFCTPKETGNKGLRGLRPGYGENHCLRRSLETAIAQSPDKPDNA